jgi:hypothetical protein
MGISSRLSLWEHCITNAEKRSGISAPFLHEKLSKYFAFINIERISHIHERISIEIQGVGSIINTKIKRR